MHLRNTCWLRFWRQAIRARWTDALALLRHLLPPFVFSTFGSIRMRSRFSAVMRAFKPRRNPSAISTSCASSPLWQIHAPRPPTVDVCTPPSAETPYRTSDSIGCFSRQATQVRVRTAGVLGLLARWGICRSFSGPCPVTGNVNAETGESRGKASILTASADRERERALWNDDGRRL